MLGSAPIVPARSLINWLPLRPQANVVFANELHRRYAEQGIVSVSLHPGNLKTDLQRHVSKVEAALTVRTSRRTHWDGDD